MLEEDMKEEDMKEEDIMFTEYPLIPIMFLTDSYLHKLSVSGLEYMIGSEPSLRHAKK
ncbi:peptide-binding protein [Bacillus pseudomycoides]|uniref:peptide-binding protein n=1 Tax=Bacillus pseudomycoides TaxID=64104 RepID=UPI003F6497F7